MKNKPSKAFTKYKGQPMSYREFKALCPDFVLNIADMVTPEVSIFYKRISIKEDQLIFVKGKKQTVILIKQIKRHK
jgi:hypothetical protein